MISKEHYQSLCSAAVPHSSMTQSDAQLSFTQNHQAYFDEQNQIIETHGIFGEEWRVW